MELRDYQKRIAQQTAEKVREFGFCYIAAEVRTGKTLMALKAAELLGKKNVLFLTKKKAIKSIEDDYTNFGFSYKIRVINYESLHKIRDKYDLVICDEAHTMGGFPKPSLRVSQLRNNFYNIDKILLSGTPHPESFSQIFYQFYVCAGNPFIGLNFYQWAKIYVDIKQKNFGFGMINDYSIVDESKSGKTWQKQTIVIETTDAYPKQIAVEVSEKALSRLQDYSIGQTITCSINIESREYNGRWFTSVKAWKI